MKGKVIKCCYLINLLTNINNAIVKEDFRDETKMIILIIWERLSKEDKLCDNCNYSLNSNKENKLIWKKA